MQIYKHLKSGGLYIKICEAYNEAQGTADKLVVYRSVDTGQTWARPKFEFEDGRFELQPLVLPGDAQRVINDMEDFGLAAAEVMRVCSTIAASTGLIEKHKNEEHTQEDELMALMFSAFVAAAIQGVDVSTALPDFLRSVVIVYNQKKAV